MASPSPQATPVPAAAPPPAATGEFAGWLSGNWIGFLIVAACLVLVWRYARPFVHRTVVGVLSAQERAMPTGSPEDELAKRAATLEDLANRLIRFFVVIALAFVLIGALGLWPAVAGLGLVLAALTVAGQSVILDYIMGILILIEGQYFKGDTISTGSIQGQVEEVGLRRTVIRDVEGIVHSVSNGTIRVSSNLTRIFAVARVDLEGVHNRDVETVIVIMDQVGRGMAEDPAWAELIVDTPAYTSTTAFTDIGLTLRMSGKVRTQGRWTVTAELRRRLALAMAAADVHLQRRISTPTRQEATDDDVTGTGGGASGT